MSIWSSSRRVAQHPENIMFVRDGDVIVGMYEIGSKKDETEIGYMNFIYGYAWISAWQEQGSASCSWCKMLRARDFNMMMLSSKIGHEKNAAFYAGLGFTNKGPRLDRPGD